MSAPGFQLEHCRTADAAEAAAFSDMYDAAPAAFAAAVGLRIERIAGATLLMAPGLPTPMFNRTIGFGTFEPASEAALDAIVERFRAAGARQFWVSVSPAAQPPGLPDWLHTRGFTHPPRKAWVQMRWPAGTPAPAIPSTLSVDEVRRHEALEVGQAIAAAFDMPPPMAPWLASLVERDGWRGFAARVGGRIAGGAFVYVLPPLGWLGMGSILPQHRGVNGQLALMSVRIAHALDEGCSAIHTETGEPVAEEPNPSLRNMVRCGFERVASRANYEK